MVEELKKPIGEKQIQNFCGKLSSLLTGLEARSDLDAPAMEAALISAFTSAKINGTIGTREAMILIRDWMNSVPNLKSGTFDAVVVMAAELSANPNGQIQVGRTRDGYRQLIFQMGFDV